MKTELITRRCLNCGIDTHKGLFCARCDKVQYIAWMFAEFHSDPEIRLKFLEEQDREKITCAKDLIDAAAKKKAVRLDWLGRSIRRHFYKLSFDAERNIYSRALRLAKSDATAEIEARQRALLESENGMSLADEYAENVLRQGSANGNFSRKNPEWDADYSKNQKAYAGFTPANSEPELGF